MTLADLLFAPLPDTDTLQTLGLVFPTPLAQGMVNAHAWYGDPRCTVFPAALADGRWCHVADILPDCVTPGGTYHAGFAHLNPENFTQVEVIPLADLTFAEGVPQLVPEARPTEESPGA